LTLPLTLAHHSPLTLAGADAQLLLCPTHTGPGRRTVSDERQAVRQAAGDAHGGRNAQTRSDPRRPQLPGHLPVPPGTPPTIWCVCVCVRVCVCRVCVCRVCLCVTHHGVCFVWQVPRYAGNPLDPPLRSRFQAYSVPPLSLSSRIDTLSREAPSLSADTVKLLASAAEAFRHADTGNGWARSVTTVHVLSS
jgi:hypothetical protein